MLFLIPRSVFSCNVHILKIRARTASVVPFSQAPFLGILVGLLRDPLRGLCCGLDAGANSGFWILYIV